MKIQKKHLFSILLISAAIAWQAGATTFFSGLAGAKLNYSADSTTETYNPDLKLQAFFAGQFNFSQNIMSHMEFSVDTKSLIKESVFHATDAKFQIDELSMIFRGMMANAANYFSTFMGTYDPIGSDIFLQRYFSLGPIDSKLTESYMGLAGSILYPHFGFGLADIVKMNTLPVAAGGYIYFNHEDKDYYVFNADLRSAGAFQYFTYDVALGIGLPLADKYKDENVYIAIEKIYWHAGTTLLFGNSFTNSLFIQAGLYNGMFKAGEDNMIVAPDDIYLLLEPRFISKNSHVNVTFYSLPKSTVEKLLFIDDTLGLDVNVYSEDFVIGSGTFTLGTHFSFSLADQYLFAPKEAMAVMKSFRQNIDKINLNITPYISTNFLSGELHLQMKLRVMDFARNTPKSAISADLGYRTTF